MQPIMKVITDHHDKELVTLEAGPLDETGPGYCAINIGRMRMLISAEQMLELGKAALNMATHATIRRAA
jgi:hypothetical protein